MKKLLTAVLVAVLFTALLIPAAAITTADLSIPKAVKVPVIDGKFDPSEGWGDPISVITFDQMNENFISDMTWEGDAEILPQSVTTYLLWDETHLYFCSVIVDPIHYYDTLEGDLGAAYAGDGFQFDIKSLADDDTGNRNRYFYGLNADEGYIVVNQDKVELDAEAEGMDEPGWSGCAVTRDEETQTTVYETAFDLALNLPEKAVSEGSQFYARAIVLCCMDEGTEDIVDVNVPGMVNGDYAYWLVTCAPGAEADAGTAAPAAASGEAPAVGSDAAAKMFTDFESYPSFEFGGDPVFNMDDVADVKDYWTGEWNGPGDTGDEKTVEIQDGVGFGGSKGLALSSAGNQNAGLYLYATDTNGIAKSYPDANYLRVWMDLSKVGFRKANFGVVNSLACLFTTDEVDGAWDCPFWYSADGVNWTEMLHGGDGCFGDAQDSDVFGLTGWFAFPVKDFTIRSSANWEAYDEQTPCDTADVWGVYLFWDYSDNYIDEQGNTFVLDNIEFVGDYKVFTYDIGGAAAPAAAAETAETSGDRATVEIGADGSLQIPKTASAMTMDGYLDDGYAKLSDFYGMDGYRTDYDADKTIKGAAYTAWDDDKFYMFLEVLTPEYEPIFDTQAIDMGIGPAGYVALLGKADGTYTDDQRFEIGIALADEDIQVWKVCSPADIKDSSADNFWFEECPYTYAVRRDADTNYIFYEFGIPWDFLDRTDTLTYTEGSQFILNYAANVHTTSDYSAGLSHLAEFGGGIWAGTYDDGAVVTLVGAPAAEAPAAEEPAEEAAPTYTYPASGAEGNAITGTVIGNETGWGDNAAAGAVAAFDGDPATFFDPLGVGDGFCGIDAGESYILDKVVILSRENWNDRFPGAMIQGSNDGENWTTLWTSDTTGTYPDYYTVTEFENNTGYSQFRYFNETNHGDVAEVEFYGTAGTAEAGAPAEEAPAEEAPALPDVENYALGARVVVTSTETDDFPGELAVDGDLETRWSSAYNDNEEITIDLGKAKAVNSITLYWETAMASDYVVYGSTDPNDWYENELVSVSGNADNVNTLEFGTTAAQYITIRCAKRATEWGSSLYEIVVSGEGDASVDETLDNKAEAPNTFDFGIVAAVAAVISLGGFAVSKKKH